MHTVFLITPGNVSSHLKKIFNNRSEGLVSLFIQKECPTSSVDEVLKKNKEVRDKISHLQIAFADPQVKPVIILERILGAGTDILIIIINTNSLKSFLKFAQKKLYELKKEEFYHVCKITEV